MVSFGILLNKDSLRGVVVTVPYPEPGDVAKIGTKTGAKSKVSSKNAIRFCIPSFKVGTPISECSTLQNVTYSVFSCGCKWQMSKKMRDG
jgi:hypothetical protein